MNGIKMEFNVFDKVMHMMLVDSASYNDESLRLMEKPIFDPDQQIQELDISDWLVLKLAYSR